MESGFVGVGVGVLVNKDDEILLMKRINSHGSGTWAPPGGHLEYGESFEECAIRECKEETDLDITNIKFKTITNDIFRDSKKHYVTVWMEAEYLSGEAKVNAEDELSEIGWYRWDELPKPLFLSIRNLIEGRNVGSL